MTIFAKVYVDEDIDVLVAHLLGARGFDVKTVREMAMLSKSDHEQLEFAVSLERCLLTHNRLDCERLHTSYIANNKSHQGILVAKRKNAYEIAERTAILLDTFTADEMVDQLFYV